MGASRFENLPETGGDGANSSHITYYIYYIVRSSAAYDFRPIRLNKRILRHIMTGSMRSSYEMILYTNTLCSGNNETIL